MNKGHSISEGSLLSLQCHINTTTIMEGIECNSGLVTNSAEVILCQIFISKLFYLKVTLHLRNTPPPVDIDDNIVYIICSVGHTTCPLSIICHYSSWLGDIFSETLCQCLDHSLCCPVPSVHLPQFNICTVQYLVTLVTEGKVTVKDEDDVTKIFELQQHLAIVTEV